MGWNKANSNKSMTAMQRWRKKKLDKIVGII